MVMYFERLQTIWLATSDCGMRMLYILSGSNDHHCLVQKT